MNKKPQQQLNEDAGEIETTAPTTKKKAKAVRSPAHVAASAVTTLRQLADRHVKAEARFSSTAQECRERREKLLASLTPDVKAMVERMMGTEPN